MRASPLKGLSPQYREFRQGISSMNTGLGLHHAYTDPTLSLSKSSADEGYGTAARHSSDLPSSRSDDVRHERTGSKDSGGDYALIGK